LWDFENREEVKGGWRKLHNEELQDLCCSSNIVSVFSLRRMKRLWYVGCVLEGDWHAWFWWRKRPHSRWED